MLLLVLGWSQGSQMGYYAQVQAQTKMLIWGCTSPSSNKNTQHAKAQPHYHTTSCPIRQHIAF